MKRLPTAAGVLAAAALLSGCTPVADVEAAPDAENPACAEVMVYLPVEVAETPLRDTNSQATAAWGNPSKVILRCGVPVPGPTTEPCASVNGVDWLLREEGETWRATTYGREPAVEVVFNPNEVASSTLLVELAGPVSRIEPTRECLSPQDTLDIP